MQEEIKKRERSGEALNRTFQAPSIQVQQSERERLLSLVSDMLFEPEINYLLANSSSDQRPYLNVKIFGNDFFGLLDTGASRTVLGTKGWKKLQDLGLSLNKEEKFELFVANGKSCNCIASLEVPITLEDRTKLMKILYVPEVNQELILGIDFWRNMNILPNMNKNTWEFLDSLDNVNSEQGVRSVLTSEEELELNNVVEPLFAKMGDKIGQATLVEHHIITDSTPIKQRYYRVNPLVQKHINEELQKMLDNGIVEPSTSPWSSPILLIKKKDGAFRFVVDFRQVNKVTKKDAYPLPYVDTILDRLRNAHYISSLDIRLAYWQIPVAASSREKTAFTVPGRGLFQFKRMPFGLHNAPATWQRFIDKLVAHEFEENVFVYLDDIIIISKTFEEHIRIIKHLIEKLMSAGLTLNREKCHFCVPEIKYLGYLVNNSGLHVDPEKVSAILNIPAPTNVSEVRRFVGVASWYRRFVPSFSSIIAPITNLLRKRTKFSWTPDCDKSFRQLKEYLTHAPILNCPDYNLPFQVQCDASAYGLGAVLIQISPDGEKVICYASRSLNRAERNYSTTERECLGVVWAVEKFKPYLQGTTFTVLTDHYSLKWLNNLKDPTGRLARWAVRLQQFDYEIIHRKGKEHLLPDLLSRSTEEHVSLITVENNTVRDPWYRELCEKIKNEPDHFSRWKLEDGNLLKSVLDYRTKEYRWRLVVPKDLRDSVFQECHDVPTSGHQGIFKTLKRITSLYYWPKLQSDVRRYVASCKICQANKPSQQGPLGLMGKRPLISHPWQLISTDLMEFPRSKEGHENLLVVTDYFSKYAILIPMGKAKAQKVVKNIKEKVFLVYGVPQYLICDNGPQFKSREFGDLMKEHKVKIMFNANYHPQNNPTERTNRIIKTMIRSYLQREHTCWDKHIAEIMCAINTGTHEVTGFTPHYINFGREHNLYGTIYTPNGNGIPEIDRSNLAYQPEKHSELFSSIRKALNTAYERNKRVYDLRRRDERFVLGQKVWKKNFVLSDASKRFSSKLAPAYVGPFLIKEILSPCTYRLEDENGTDKGVWHVSHLKAFTE